ncbi:MAG: DNA-directed RNA polymerase sigma-70 factor [Planctomycetaceae bacterium]|nr:MAG: DNA-directed RNA polymerase sigma-70 factor [Planctomycetaceae bacterium]
MNAPPGSDETRELLAAAEQGDREAVNVLLARYRDMLRRMVQMRIDRALQRRLDASDIVQDVLLEAHRRLQDYFTNPQLPFGVWLRRLAHDRMIEMYRQHRVSQRRSLDREQALSTVGAEDGSQVHPLERVADPELTPMAAALKQERRQRFLQAIACLDDEDREIVWLRHVEQLSNSEVATLLQVTPAAAGMRHLRALRRLKDILQNSGELTLPPPPAIPDPKTRSAET